MLIYSPGDAERRVVAEIPERESIARRRAYPARAKP
jgi:hypothetical protein